MTLNGAMALILRYFTEFGSFRGALRKVAEDIPKLSATTGTRNVAQSMHVVLSGRYIPSNGLM